MNVYSYVSNVPVMRADPLGLWDAPFANMPGLQERASLGTHMMNNGESPEAVARAMAPPPPRPIATFECRASATVAGGLGVSVAGAVNEVSGFSRQVSVPMTSFAARIAGSCGIKIADPDAKNFKAGLAGAMSFGLVSVEAGQNSSGGELYIGVGPGVGPELRVPYNPNPNVSIPFEAK